MHIVPNGISKNIRSAEMLIRRAANRGAQLIVLPEMWPAGFDFSRIEEYPRNENLKRLAGRMSALAKSLDIHIAAGSWLHFPSGRGKGKAYNRAHFFARDGRQVAHYDKIHLFPPMLEDKFLQAGRRPNVFNSVLGKTAMAICYDLRFPELFVTCARKGAEYFIMSAAWPAERVDMMLETARTRAVENRCFVVLANCCGATGEETFGGRSCVFAPSGRSIFIAPPKKSGVYILSVNPADVARCRRDNR